MVNLHYLPSVKISSVASIIEHSWFLCISQQLDYCYPKFTNQIASLEVTIRDSYLARGNY